MPEWCGIWLGRNGAMILRNREGVQWELFLEEGEIVLEGGENELEVNHFKVLQDALAFVMKGEKPDYWFKPQDS